jgi:flagellar biosynthetic protein FlhB
MSDAGDRTLPATPRRREAARCQGAMPTAAGPAWAAAAVTAVALGPAWLRATIPAAADVVRRVLATAATPGGDPGWSDLLPGALVLPTAGLVLASASTAVAVRLLVDGFSWQPARAAPDLRRIDPLAGLARILSGRTLAAAAGHGLALAILVAVAVASAAPLGSLVVSGDGLLDPARLLPAAWRPLAWLAGGAAVVAACQWAFARRRFEARIRMTPQEFADEARSMQADPKVRLLQQRRPAQPKAGTA